MKKMFFLLACLLVLSACNNNAQGPATEEKDNTVQGDLMGNTGDGETGSIMDADEEQNNATLPLRAYFMKDGTVASFEGEGNEYATYTTRTKYLDKNFVSVTEDNGGTTMLSIYRIEGDQVLLVWQEPEQYDDMKASELDLESLVPMQVYLRAPLEKGKKFDEWVVADTNATLVTPYKTFNNVLVTEFKSEDGINRRYFAKGYGEIKREYIMNDQTTISSTLSDIK